jgi:hypothetical protein
MFRVLFSLRERTVTDLRTPVDFVHAKFRHIFLQFIFRTAACVGAVSFPCVCKGVPPVATDLLDAPACRARFALLPVSALVLAQKSHNHAG